MERIGVRELRQHASRWLRRVADGECYEITVRGSPVARLGPPVPAGGALERLASEGLADPPSDDLSAALDRLGLPLDANPVSDRLAELRQDER
ncbi:MAG: type II toxin-antitoxin system prevent-host-death family antitoxin [bacterium]|nr:type II toxin-antitoxin system prevent-host-death family antitoxin [bacterium]